MRRVKKQILIVDDDQRVLDALRRTLHDQSDDWAMTFVRHPEKAWESLLRDGLRRGRDRRPHARHQRHGTARAHPADRQDQGRARRDADRA